MNHEKNIFVAKEIVIGIVVASIMAILVHYADIPTRVSVVESRIDGIKDDIHDIKRMLNDIKEGK